MKRAIIFCVILLIAGTVSADNLQWPAGTVIARNYGTNKSDTTIATLTNALDTAYYWTIIVDGGSWSITDDVAWPTNTAVFVTPDSFFNLSAGATMTFNNVWLDHGPTKLFTGSGGVAGTPSFWYRHAEWGSTSTYDIGEGIFDFGGFTSLESWVTNGLYTWMTNTYPNLDTNYLDDCTNIYVGTQTGSTGGVSKSSQAYTINFPLAGSESYISGAYPVWNSATTVTVTNGEGYCSGDWFTIIAPIAYTMTSMVAGAEDFHYIYCDDSASSYPTNITVIDSSTEPAYSTTYQGWYNGDDRCLGALLTTNGTVGLMQYEAGQGGHVGWLHLRWMALDLNPSGVLQVPTVQSDTLLPVNAFIATFDIHGEDAGAIGTVGIAPVGEQSAGDPVNTVDGYMLMYNEGYTRFGYTDTVRLGQSRAIFLYGNNDDDNKLSCSIRGYLIDR